ncbi:hypothetical protein OIU76_026137 [Salix suchowensis]|nr:hypothetical protein OIU76_026137 [Salix suchowensis]
MSQTQHYRHLNLTSLGDQTAIDPLRVTSTVDHHAPATRRHLCILGLPSSIERLRMQGRKREVAEAWECEVCWLNWRVVILIP